jgi:hypothetical protein
MKQFCIAIVGAGEIGSRHLQALCHLKSPVRIDLVDPSNQSLQIARDRCEETLSCLKDKSIELRSHNSLVDLPDKLDLVIVATNSSVREKVIKAIIEKSPPKNLILEKVLFQRTDQYAVVKNILNETLVPTWVSCWMRTTELFKRIKFALDLDYAIELTVNGSSWGMGTNSIHFMDLFSYITECNNLKFIDVQLDKEILNSRHKGFNEFSGQMTGQNLRGDTLSLSHLKTADAIPTIEIVNGPNRYKVLGLLGKVSFESSNDLANQIGEPILPYQSQLTHIWVDDILSRGTCELPTYEESIPLHLELVRVFTEHLETITGKIIEACPIT